MRDSVKARSVAVLGVNTYFGKGGRDTFIKEMAARNIKVTTDISTESGQADFSTSAEKSAWPDSVEMSVVTLMLRAAIFLMNVSRPPLPKYVFTPSTATDLALTLSRI